MKKWFVYILECSDGTLYTGITTDINRRLNQHNTGKGAKYTCGRRPVVLLDSFTVESKSIALKEEYHIKQLSRKEKIEYVLKQQK
jgi:putative endonuclease